MTDLQNHVNTRLGNRSFTLEISQDARQFLLEKGSSAEYGARELNRTIHRFLTQPLATLVATNQISPGAQGSGGGTGEPRQAEHPFARSRARRGAANPTVMLVDDNRDLLHFLERLMADAGWTLLTAESATEAKRLMALHKPDAALLDYMLPDGNGVELGVEFLQSAPNALVIVMTGTILPPKKKRFARSTISRSCESRSWPPTS